METALVMCRAIFARLCNVRLLSVSELSIVSTGGRSVAKHSRKENPHT